MVVAMMANPLACAASVIAAMAGADPASDIAAHWLQIRKAAVCISPICIQAI
jgi:hypothetical protein